MPGGLAFPFPFGFIPNTKGEDEDPLDAFVLSEFTGFPGCVMDCRIVGCIQVEQAAGNKRIRNDRFMAVPKQSHLFREVETITDIKSSLIIQLENFLTRYMSLAGKDGRLIGNLNAQLAMELIQSTKAGEFG